MKVFRYTPRSFERALAAGVFGDRKVELIAGMPHIMTTNPPHVFAVRRLAALLAAAYPPDAFAIYEEKFIALGTWRPQPDLAVIRHPADAYLPRLAGPDDIELIVEVSDTTYALDRSRKWRKYASAGIPSYWIVDLQAGAVEVFERPQGNAYPDPAIYYKGDSVRGIAVSDILPPGPG